MNNQINTLLRNSCVFIQSYDIRLTAVVAHIPNSLQKLSAAIGHATLPIIWVAILIVTCFATFHAGEAKLTTIGLMILACIPLGTLLKLLVRRHRPKTLYAKNMKIKSYSFPSSHAYSATLAGGYFVILSLHLLAGPLSYVIACLCALLVIIIGISRVHIGAHYPTDVSAGWLLGVVVLYGATRLIS